MIADLVYAETCLAKIPDGFMGWFCKLNIFDAYADAKIDVDATPAV
ncbi:hypothetical protein [Aeromonas enteropelogenes]